MISLLVLNFLMVSLFQCQQEYNLGPDLVPTDVSLEQKQALKPLFQRVSCKGFEVANYHQPQYIKPVLHPPFLLMSLFLQQFGVTTTQYKPLKILAFQPTGHFLNFFNLQVQRHNFYIFTLKGKKIHRQWNFLQTKKTNIYQTFKTIKICIVFAFEFIIM